LFKNIFCVWKEKTQCKKCTDKTKEEKRNTKEQMECKESEKAVWESQAYVMGEYELESRGSKVRWCALCSAGCVGVGTVAGSF
jgi:ribosomal protein S26